MARNIFVQEASSIHLKSMEPQAPFSTPEKGRVKDVILSQLEAIVDDSFTPIEAAKLPKIERLDVEVWPRTRQHKTKPSRSQNKDGLQMTVSHESTIRLATTSAEDGGEKMLTRCSVSVEKEIRLTESKTALLSYCCVRDSDHQNYNYISIIFPEGVSSRQTELRIYTHGRKVYGEMIALNGGGKSIHDLLTQLNKNLPLKIDLGLAGDYNNEEITRLETNLRSIIFTGELPKVKVEDDIPF